MCTLWTEPKIYSGLEVHIYVGMDEVLHMLVFTEVFFYKSKNVLTPSGAVNASLFHANLKKCLILAVIE